MGEKTIILKIVLDTSVLLSALLFSQGKLAWLRESWRSGQFVPLASTATTRELIRTLGYPKFGLSAEEVEILLADYLPYADIVSVGATKISTVRCRDKSDQMFLDLAITGRADVLVSSDKDLLVLSGDAPLAIETFAEFRRRFV